MRIKSLFVVYISYVWWPRCPLTVTVLPPAGRYGIMLACWQGEPRERPTFPALVEILGDLLQDNSLPVRLHFPFRASGFSYGKYFGLGWGGLHIPLGREGLHPSEPLPELRGRRLLPGLITPSIWRGAENGLQHPAHQVLMHAPLTFSTCILYPDCTDLKTKSFQISKSHIAKREKRGEEDGW